MSWEVCDAARRDPEVAGSGGAGDGHGRRRSHVGGAREARSGRGDMYTIRYKTQWQLVLLSDTLGSGQCSC